MRLDRRKGTRSERILKTNLRSYVIFSGGHIAADGNFYLRKNIDQICVF